MSRDRLRSLLLDAMRAGAETTWSEDRFNRLALEIFRYQTVANPVYGGFARNRGVAPEALDDWRQIPPVPATAFKDFPEGLVPPGPIQAVFRTSGTTLGGRRGEHRVRDLSLYHASLLSTATAYLRGEAGLRILALMPSPRDLPDSSLCHMAGVLASEWGDGSGGFFAAADWSIMSDEWEEALRDAARRAIPVMVLATAFSLVAWMDGRPPRPLPSLPPGSFVVETGGYKGRSRSVPRGELYAAVQALVGVPARRIVAEFGMTEMLSQFYEPVLLEAAPEDPAERHFVGPPWVRTQVLDPSTLDPVAAGDRGLLCHIDLANLDSVAGILTEDEGIEVGTGFRVLGRIHGAEPRGCSLAIEDFLLKGSGRARRGGT